MAENHDPHPLEQQCQLEFRLASNEAYEGIDDEVLEIRERLAQMGHTFSTVTGRQVVDAFLQRFKRVLRAFEAVYLDKWSETSRPLLELDYEWLKQKADAELGLQAQEIERRCSNKLWSQNQFYRQWWEKVGIDARSQIGDIVKKIEILKLEKHRTAWWLSLPVTDLAERIVQQREDLKGPAQQWKKAVGHLARQPPDPENAIKDAIGTLEGVSRILSQRHSSTFAEIIKPLAEQLQIHGALRNAMSNIFGYRGDGHAIAHGTTTQLEDKAAEAKLLLHWCAAAIFYLLEKSQTSSSVERDHRGTSLA